MLRRRHLNVQDDTLCVICAAKAVGTPSRRNREDDDDEQNRDPRHQYINPTNIVHSIFGGKVSIESKRECKLLKRAS